MTRIRTVLQTEWLALLAMLGLLVLFFPKVATFRECLFIGDILQQFYPYTTYSFERIVKDGELPLWTHQIRMGYPLFAEGQSGILFPTNWLYFLFPPPIAFSCAILSHVLLAAIGTYAFLRSSAAKRPLSRIAALTGAVLYAYSGRLLVSVLDVSDLRVLAALPWCLWALYGLRQKPSLRSMLACACALMLLGLAGKPDVAFQAVAVLLLAAAALIVCREESPPLPRPGARPFVIFFVLAGVLSLVLSAVQWIPTLELLDQSVRRESVPLERWISGSLPPKQILSFVVPWLFGSPYEGTYVGAWSFLFLEMYLGSLGGFLVILGATPAWPRGLGSGRTGSRERLLWLVVAFVGLVLSLGKYLPGYAWLHEVPLLGYGRVPSRWLHVTVFGAAILAAHGMAFLETMLAEGDPDRGAGNRLLLALAAAGLLLLAAAPIAFGPTTDQFPDYALAGTKISFTQSAERAARLATERRLAWLQSAVLLALTAGITLSTARVRPLRRWAGAILLVALIVDQRVHLADLNPTRPASVFEPKSRVIDFLRKAPGARFYSRRSHVPAYFLARTQIRRGTEDEVLASFYRHVTPNCALLAGLNDALGYGELDYAGRAEPDLSLEGLKKLSSWGVRFIVTYRDDEDLPPDAEVVLESEDAVVIEIRPRPYYEVTTGGGGRTEVLMRDSYYPGWIAFLDGHQADVSRQGPFKRATFTPGAAESPTDADSVGALFIYDPLSFRAGLAISLAGLLVLASLAAVRRGHQT